MQTLQETIHQYSVRLKSLEDFIGLQFGEAYQQFRLQNQDEEEYENSGVESSYDSQDDVNEIIHTKIKQENVAFSPKPLPVSFLVQKQPHNTTATITIRKPGEICRNRRQQFTNSVPVPVLENNFVSVSVPEEIDPLEVEENYWNDEDNEIPVAVEYGDDHDTNNSQLFDVYDEDDEDEQNDLRVPQIAGTSIVRIPSSSTEITSTNVLIFKTGNCTVQKVAQPDETERNYIQQVKLFGRGHECPFCENQYETRTGVFHHVLDDHTGGQSYCPLCQKSYSLQKDFRCHLQRHDKRNKIRFRCSYCAKYFGSRKELNNHERVHTGEKPYCCETCQKNFRTSSSLIRHQKCHGRNVCKYPNCKQRFLFYKDLFKHQSSANHFLK